MEFAEVNPVFQQMLDQLQKAAENLPKTHERMRSLTGEAWSDDGMVKAVVGPRGQLVDLEIDPRVFRQPDAEALRARILGAAAAAAREVGEQAREIMDAQLPSDMKEVRAKYVPGAADTEPDPFVGDAEWYAERQVDR